MRDSTEALGTSDHDSSDTVHTESVQYRRTDSGILYERTSALSFLVLSFSSLVARKSEVDMENEVYAAR